MAKRKKTRSDDPTGFVSGGNAEQVERLTNLVALLLIKGEPQADQLRTLACTGFTNTEIATLARPDAQRGECCAS